MGCFCTCPTDFTGGVFLYLCQTDPTGWVFLYLSHTDSTGEAFLYLSHIDLTSGVFLYLFVVSVPGLGGGVGSWRHHRLSVCVLCVCARPWWWCGVLASSQALCVLCLCQALVVVWGPGVITGSLCVRCVCARPWWWCGVPASSRVPCVLSSSSASADCPRPEARPSPWRSRTSKPGTRTKRRKRRGAKTCIRQQHKATAWRSRTSKPGTHRRRNRRRAKSRNRQRHKATELWPASRRRTLELPSITTAYRAAVFISCCLSQRQRGSGKWSDNANGLKFLTIIVMKCL